MISYFLLQSFKYKEYKSEQIVKNKKREKNNRKSKLTYKSENWVAGNWPLNCKVSDSVFEKAPDLDQIFTIYLLKQYRWTFF